MCLLSYTSVKISPFPLLNLGGLQEESRSIINLIHHVVDVVLTNKEKWEATEIEQKVCSVVDSAH